MQVSLKQLAGYFLRLGSIGFGGPLALVAMMEQECVHQKKWISRQRFEETFVFCKMLPGPLAYQMALWVGYEVRGWMGGLIAGTTFVLPAATLLYLFAKFYDVFEQIKGASHVMDGMRVGALVVILQSVYSLIIPHRRDGRAWLFMVFGGVAMALLPRAEPLIILGGGILSLWWYRGRNSFHLKLSPATVLLTLFWTHFKAGAFVFGTGLAIIPVIQREVVEVYGWLTQAEFLDALAFGQITPGPITTISAFIGFKVWGGLGSFIATFGIYFPGALMILAILPRIRSNLEGKKELVDFQLGALPTVIGCLAMATVILLYSVVNTPPLIIAFVLLLGVQLKWKLPPGVIIILGSFSQWLLRFFF